MFQPHQPSHFLSTQSSFLSLASLTLNAPPYSYYGFSVSALWCPLATPTVLLGFLLPWAWGISSRMLQQSVANAPYLGQGVSPHRRPSWPSMWDSPSMPSCALSAWGCSSRPLPLASGLGGWGSSSLVNLITLGPQPCLTQWNYGRVMVERSDRMWSIGEGNGKPLQYSCLENPMNSMKRQKW